MAAGLIASLCCGGSLIFASIGLGGLWSLIGLSRFIPQALAAGALLIVAINYFFYHRAAERVADADDGRIPGLRRGMFLSTALGLGVMATGFVFLEWLNHAVVDPHRFLVHSQYGQALIPGVPNVRLLYALASFAALALLWALPFPQPGGGVVSAVRWSLRGGVFVATAAVIVVLAVGAMKVQVPGGQVGEQHSPATQRRH